MAVAGKPPLLEAQTKILLADTEPMLLDALAYILEHDGYRTITAANGVTTLALVHSEQPHCLDLDSELPDLSGLQVCRALRQMGGKAKRLPLLLTSMRKSENDKVRAG